LKGIMAQVRAEETPTSKPMDGDIHLFQFGRTMSHCGVICDDLLYHAVFGTRLIAIPWNDAAWSSRRRKAFRIVEAE
ncbi:MAG: hypothetical protein HQK55_15460, partial [Deltaproteobacteria bacterium]|nr:hypothetical protein [Deltaproteobacteria bacterium]